MLKKLNLVGLIIGVAIIVCSFLVFNFDAETESPDMNVVSLDSITAPQYELDKSYGGDAYTGMQQAAAQAANNLIPVFKAIEANNEAITKLNKNAINAAETEAENAEAIVSTIQYCVGFILIAIGLTVISKSIVFEISLTKKKEEPQETVTCM